MNLDLNIPRIPSYCHYLSGLCATVVLVLILALPEESVSSSEPEQELALALPSADQNAGPDNANNQWRTVQVQAGDSLSQVFSRLDLGAEELASLLACCPKEKQQLQRLQPGQFLQVLTDQNQVLQELIVSTLDAGSLHFVRQEDRFAINATEPTLETRTAFSTGFIKHSFYQSALKAGMSDELIMELVDILKWHIDFASEIKRNDHFTVLYEETYLAGEKTGNGAIIAAEFDHQGTIHRALRYTNQQGETHYYTAEGQPINRRTFLRTPVDFRRISSHFQANRWHPVLGKKRPHRGVDYAAPRGTPVWAAGDGTVEFVGRQSGYGKVIILRHGQRYSTLYAHLSRFHSGIRKGHSVKQGEVIGYVGSTGLATGPHLHYEFRVDGRHVNPVTAKLPGPEPMGHAQLADFRAKTADLVAQLDVHQRVRLALLAKR
ncbi:MAG: peptidoglycan DD-metalloendopeptidase family protein [Candidatus Competibacteraceae bacterium]|nr:peptidoglycan DD-metalloendopeptidase family protein [Candidatus Competibacteraceae bacterium]